MSDATVAQWYALYRAHKSLAKVGRIVGRHPNTLRQVLRAHGWQLQKRGNNGTRKVADSYVACMYEHYSRTGSLAKTAEAFGRTLQTVAYLFHSRGYKLKRPGTKWPAHFKAAA